MNRWGGQTSVGEAGVLRSRENSFAARRIRHTRKYGGLTRKYGGLTLGSQNGKFTWVDFRAVLLHEQMGRANIRR